MTQVNNKTLNSLNTSMGAFSTSSKHTDDGSDNDNDFEQLKKVKKVDKKKVVLEVSEEESEEEEEEEEESSSSDEEEPPKKAVVNEVKKPKEVKHIDHEIGIIPPKPTISKYYSAIILYKHKYKKEHSKDAVLTDKEYDMMYNKLTPEEKEPYETQSKADKEKATGPYNAWAKVYGKAWAEQQQQKKVEEEEKKKILPATAAVVVAQPATVAQKVTQPVPDDLLNVMFRIFDERYQLKVAPAVAAVAAVAAVVAKPRKRKSKTDTPVKKAKVESEEEAEEEEEKIFNKKSVNHFVASSF